jgi:outer membrane protein assembly factor BamB
MGTPSRGRKWPRTAAVVVAAVLATAASAGIVYRVLAPAEVVTPARAATRVPQDVPPGVIGTLNAAPVIVDGRVRIFAATRQVWADQPLNAKTRRSPAWSYRRWPAQVTGVLAVGDTAVTRWSDGELVALDALTGRVRWRVAGPNPEQVYTGRRTGAATVYAPAGLWSVTTNDNRSMLVVAGPADRRGIDLNTGREVWAVQVDGGCRADDLTTSTGQVAAVDTCASPQVVEFRDAATGAPTSRWRPADGGAELTLTALGCAASHSACPAIRTSSDGRDQGWRLTEGIPAGEPVPMRALDAPESVLAGDVAISPESRGLTAYSLRTGGEMWRRGDLGPARILAVQPGRVHLFNESGDLVNLDSVTGNERSRFPLTYGRDSTVWEPGFTYAAGGYLTVERLAEPVDPAAADDRYYLAAQPVILAAT